METDSLELKPLQDSKAGPSPKYRPELNKSQTQNLNEKITGFIRAILALGLLLLVIYSLAQALLGLLHSFQHPSSTPREPGSDIKSIQSILGILQQESYKTGLLPIAGASFGPNYAETENQPRSPRRAQWWRQRNGYAIHEQNKTNDQQNISNARRSWLLWGSESTTPEPSEESWNAGNKSASIKEHFKGQQNLYPAPPGEKDIQTKSNNSLGN